MSEKVNIFIVDDNEDARDVLKEFVQRGGHSYKTASSEEDAIRMIKDGYVPESALIDVSIPEGRRGRIGSLDSDSFGLTGGLRLAKFILKEVGDMCRIIIWSGLDHYRVHAQEAGVWGFVHKGEIPHSGILVEMLGQGFLKNHEIGKPTLHIGKEIRRRKQGIER